MPKTFTDQTATVVGTPLNSSNLNNLLTSADIGVASGVPGLDGNSHVPQQAVYDATEAATNDTLGSASTVVNNLNRIRYVLTQMQGVAWTTARAILNASGQLLATATAGALAVNGHLSVSSGTPTITQPTSGSSAISGNDQRGRLTYATGATPGSGLAFQVTFASAYASTPTVVLSTEYDSGNTTSFQVGSVSTTGFALYNHAAPTINTTFAIQYQVMG